MSLNSDTSKVLHWGTMAGLAVICAGLVLSILDITDLLLAAGILVLIFTPVAGIAAATYNLRKEHDTFWTRIAYALCCVIVIGMLATVFL